MKVTKALSGKFNDAAVQLDFVYKFCSVTQERPVAFGLVRDLHVSQLA